ncbi:Rrf2 family transcriptional regulator [Spirulina major]|uniref:Rrf2 family transcriptional regulator n=1 Tax=Spirulina major TaxID=270636 RepID=UPI000933BD72|nr:RrF2 family transcriptional regulator [Spirulina major]
MKLTTRAHYSVKALLDLSLQPTHKPASVNAIAQRQGISAPYLEKLLIELRRAGLVYSVRGAHGGYCLAHKPTQISLGQILAAVGETINPLPHHQPDQDQAEDWVTYSLWQRLHEKLKAVLYEITLADLYYDARSQQTIQRNDHNFVV